MNAKEMNQHIDGAITAAMKSGVHPMIVFTALHSHALDVLMMLKTPPPPQSGIQAPAEPLIVLPPTG